jgi:DNA repair exonuclease SbcCD ATPase subunit
MSDPLVTCPFCGLEVPEGRFCKICGKPLDTEIPLSSQESEAQFEEDTDPIIPSKEPEQVVFPHFDVTVEDMEQEAAVILLSRSELEVVDLELDNIIERTKATRQALQLQQADKEVLTVRAEELRSAFEKTKSRRRELIAVSAQLLLEKLVAALDKDEERLEKLEAISGTLDKDVYKEQKAEIVTSLKELRTNLKEAIKSAKKWVKGIKKTLKKLDKEVSRVEAKFKIGDINIDSYDSSKARLQRSIRIVEGGRERLISLLRIAEKR